MRFLIAFFIAFTVSAQTITLTNADIKAFYTAEGHGKVATGGRGLGVFQVTNTNNTGTGSLRQAILNATSAGGGTIIFRVGGTTNWAGEMVTIEGDNITIAGETAPGDGFAIHDGGIEIAADNIIIRHIRVRHGDSGPSGDDAIRVGGNNTGEPGASTIMLDHLSISWGGDENFSVYTAGTRTVTDVTLQNSIISESFGAGARKGALIYNFGGDNSITDVSFIRNYFAHNYQRNIRSSLPSVMTVEYINNWVYGYFSGFRFAPRNDADLIGNIWEDGYDTQTGNAIDWVPCGSPCSTLGSPFTDESMTGTEIYLSDNLYNGGTSSLVNSDDSAYWTGSPKLSSGYTAVAASELKSVITANVGARQGISGRDALDAHVLLDGSDGTTGSYATAESQTIGLPTLASGTPYIDWDGDGLSNEYEIANGGGETGISPTTRPTVATLVNGTVINQNDVTAGIRYTHMDIFLGELAGDWGSGSGGGGGTTTPNALKNATSAMLIAH